MKTNKILLASCLFAIGSFLFIGCAKEDLNAPVVTLNGSDITILLQDTYTELGATANDDEDGELTPVVTGTVDVNKTGEYTITYTATDAAGNEGTAVRTVTVKNDQEAMEGKYDGSETDQLGPYTYSGNSDPAKTVTITVSTTVKNQVYMTRLGDFANNTVYLNITGTSISMPSQTNTNVGTGTSNCDVHTRRSDGTGTKNSTGFTLTYNDEKLAPCSGSRNGVVATFTKK